MLWPHVDDSPVVSRFFPNSPDDSDEPPIPVTRRSNRPVSPGAITIMVVDDDLANLALAEAVLQAEGFEVCVAMDGPSMFALLKACAPSLILMDIQLPESDGWELTRQLKADPATSTIPIIALTAYGKAGDDRKARQAGFAEFLAKPINTRELPGIVRRHLASN
jgi:two-component system, cell cycle response regulator DivK